MQYLITEYGKEKALKIYDEQSNNVFGYHGLAWMIGKVSFPYFCEIYLHDWLFDYSSGKKPLSNMHYEIWNELQDIILNKNISRNCYVFPRSFGKTQTITIPIAMWCALYGIHRLIVLDSANEDLSKDFLKSIKDIIEENSYITNCFGNVAGNKSLINNADMMEFDVKPHRTEIRCLSCTSSSRGLIYNGSRVGLLILDDTQDEKQITTEKACSDIVNRINSGIMKALQNNDNHVIALGTVQRKGDLYDTFLHSIVWKSRIEKCVRLDDIDKYFKYNKHWQEVKKILQTKSVNNNAILDAENYYTEHENEMQFPVIWNNYDCLELAKEYFDNPVAFKKERQCDINSLGEKLVYSLSAIPAEEIEKLTFNKTILSIDPAATTNKKSDYSAFCVLSETETGIKYARKCIIKKLEFEAYIDKIIQLLLDYTDIQTISIEKQVYMGADVIKLRERIAKNPELKNRPINIINRSRSQNKDNRIAAIVPDVNMGRVIFNEDDYEAIGQIKEFAGTAYTEHDDMIDALTDAMENIAESKKTVPKLKLYNLNSFGF